MSNERAGLVLSVITVLSFSLYPIAVPIGLREGLSPLSFVVLAMSIASLGLVACLLKERKPLLSSRSELFEVFPISIVFILEHVCILVALQDLKVAIAMPFMYVYPLLIAGYSSLVDREKLSFRLLGALFLSLLGLGVLVDFSWQNVASKGVFFALLQGTLAATRILMTSRLVRSTSRDSVVLTTQVFVLGILVALPVALLSDWTPPHSAEAWGVVALAGLSGFIGHMSLGLALSKVSAVRVSLILNTEPVVAALLATLILNQVLTPLQYLGALLVVLTVGAYKTKTN